MNHKKSSSRIPSAQLRLTPKAGSNKSAFNTPVPAFNTPVPMKFYNQMSPPCTPHNRGDSIVQESSLWQKRNLIHRDATNFTTDSSVENLVISMKSGKLFNQSLDANTVNGVNYKQSDQLLSDSLVVNKDIEEDKVKVSSETIKVTANLADGKRKVKIKNCPLWNGQQVYDPFASYHDQLNKDSLTVQALGTVKKCSPYFGLPARMCHVDSDASKRNIGEDTNKKELVTPVAKEFFYQNQLSPPLTPINKRDSFDSSSREGKKRGPSAMRRPNSNTCICLRSLKMILCTNCEHKFPGRIQKTCNPHPNDKYQLDVVTCPKCKVDRNGLKECDIPQEIGNISNKLITK